nr:hypothetical protein [Kitasatospora fiedleri]
MLAQPDGEGDDQQRAQRHRGEVQRPGAGADQQHADGGADRDGDLLHQGVPGVVGAQQPGGRQVRDDRAHGGGEQRLADAEQRVDGDDRHRRGHRLGADQPGDHGHAPGGQPDRAGGGHRGGAAAALGDPDDEHLQQHDGQRVGADGQAEGGRRGADGVGGERGHAGLELPVAGEEDQPGEHAQPQHRLVGDHRPQPAAALRRRAGRGRFDRDRGHLRGAGDGGQAEEGQRLDGEQPGQAGRVGGVDDLAADQGADAHAEVDQGELEREGPGALGAPGAADDHRGQRGLAGGDAGAEQEGGEQQPGRARGLPEGERADGGHRGAGQQHRARPVPVDAAAGERQHGQRGEREHGEHRARRRGPEAPHLVHVHEHVRQGEAAAESAERVADLDAAQSAAPLLHWAPLFHTSGRAPRHGFTP